MVPVKAPHAKEDMFTVPEARVQVPPPEEPSKVTLSEVVGTDCPPAPPEEAAQWVVSEESQVPVPPTQNLEAIKPCLQ